MIPLPSHRRFKDLTGHVFGRSVVTEYAGKKGRCQAWKILCECGNSKVVLASNLLNGHTQSCGCLAAERVRATHLTHGMYGTRTYRCWGAMVKRCRNPNDISYRRYGGRGITVCERWLRFENFLADMGKCPDGHSIERKDNSGDYGPGNCKWATASEQANNRRSSRFVTFEGVTLTVVQWAERTGIKTSTLFYRLNMGWDVSRALSGGTK